MSAVEILKRMEADDVHLTLSASGSIKTIGEGAAVNRWLPTIREHKAEILEALGYSTNNSSAMSDQDERRITAWLDRIGETDPAIIECTLRKCRTDFSALTYFLQRARQ